MHAFTPTAKCVDTALIDVMLHHYPAEEKQFTTRGTCDGVWKAYRTMDALWAA